MKKNIRKKSELRYEKIMEVALEMFLEKGYEKTSLNDIIKVSGGSLTLIYEHFFTKEDFFEAVISRALSTFSRDFSQELQANKDDEAEDFLFQLALLYTELIFQKKTRELIKLFFSYQGNDGNLKELFSRYLISNFDQVFVEFFSQKGKEELLRSKEDLFFYAQTFRHMLQKPLLDNFLIGDFDELLSLEFREKVIKKSIQLFLYGILKK